MVYCILLFYVLSCELARGAAIYCRKATYIYVEIIQLIGMKKSSRNYILMKSLSHINNRHALKCTIGVGVVLWQAYLVFHSFHIFDNSGNSPNSIHTTSKCMESVVVAITHLHADLPFYVHGVKGLKYSNMKHYMSETRVIMFPVFCDKKDV